MSPSRDPLADVLRFLRSVATDPWPEGLDDEPDEAVIAERLQQFRGSDDAWIARASEHERWVADVLARLKGREPEHVQRLMQPLSGLFDDLAGKAAGLGLWGGLARLMLDGRGDLEPADRELLEDALRDAAAASASAWARIDQARVLLATIDGASRG